MNINVKKQGGGFSIWLNDKCNHYGLNRRETYLVLNGMTTAFNRMKYNINVKICDEFYSSEE